MEGALWRLVRCTAAVPHERLHQNKPCASFATCRSGPRSAKAAGVHNFISSRATKCETLSSRVEGCERALNDDGLVYNYWKYDAGDAKPMRIRRTPTLDAEPIECNPLEPGEVFAVEKELAFSHQGQEVRFLKLADGRGWVFDAKPGTGRMCERDLSFNGSSRKSTEGVEVFLNEQKVFLRNGRLGNVRENKETGADGACAGWTLARNGFCLLTDQILGTPEHAFAELSGSTFQNSRVFHFPESGETSNAVCLRGDSQVSSMENYYRDVAHAAKAVFPDAEYISVPGHFVLSAEASSFGFLALSGQMLATKFLPESTVNRFQRARLGTVSMVHADLSKESGAKEVAAALRDCHLHHQLDLSGQRCVVTANFWRNIQAEPIKNNHLAVVDAQSMSEDTLLNSFWRNPVLGGKAQYRMPKIDVGNQLVYFPDMTSSEILIFKQGEYSVRCVDSDGSYHVAAAPDTHLHHVLHASFLDPHAPMNSTPRKSAVCHVTVIMKDSPKQP